MRWNRAAGLAAGVLACAVAAGCAVIGGSRGPSVEELRGPSAVELARQALAAGNLEAAEAALTPALTPKSSDRKAADAPSGPVVLGTPQTADLLVLRAELRIRQGRYPEAESDALTALALVPATPSAAPPPAPTPYGPRDDRPEAEQDETESGPPRPSLTQRAIHLRLAQLYEDHGQDDQAEVHLEASAALCGEDAGLVEQRACDLERRALIRIRLARGRYAEAEPLVLSEIQEVQSLFGPDDLRLSFALCDAARFYARQGKYGLSGPLFTRSFILWKQVHEEARAEQERAIAAAEPGPFSAEFLRPRAGHAPFTAPCGLEDQPLLLYKLGKAGVAAEALRYEQQLWAAEQQAGVQAVALVDELAARGADALEVASARHAVAFIAQRKGDLVRAEQELRLVLDAYTAAWPTLSISDRRYHVQDCLAAIESLVELLRSSKRYNEAVTLGERARDLAAAVVDPYDSVRLDTYLSLTKTFREMRDPARAEDAAGFYLDAVLKARGDETADYAWALRTISYAYLLSGELDASQRMEMQAKAIWAKQNIVAPEFP